MGGSKDSGLEISDKLLAYLRAKRKAEPEGADFKNQTAKLELSNQESDLSVPSLTWDGSGPSFEMCRVHYFHRELNDFLSGIDNLTCRKLIGQRCISA